MHVYSEMSCWNVDWALVQKMELSCRNQQALNGLLQLDYVPSF